MIDVLFSFIIKNAATLKFVEWFCFEVYEQHIFYTNKLLRNHFREVIRVIENSMKETTKMFTNESN